MEKAETCNNNSTTQKYFPVSPHAWEAVRLENLPQVMVAKNTSLRWQGKARRGKTQASAHDISTCEELREKWAELFLLRSNSGDGGRRLIRRVHTFLPRQNSGSFETSWTSLKIPACSRELRVIRINFDQNSQLVSKNNVRWSKISEKHEINEYRFV